MFTCEKCKRKFSDGSHYNINGFELVSDPKLCFSCYEESLEEHEVKRRARTIRDR